ncbi:MAG: hypothetical protein WDO16_01405 [Bacteroidota bacterium]
MNPIGAPAAAVTLAAATAVATGSNYIVLIGGDEGGLFKQLETLNLRIASVADIVEKEKLLQEKLAI